MVSTTGIRDGNADAMEAITCWLSSYICMTDDANVVCVMWGVEVCTDGGSAWRCVWPLGGGRGGGDIGVGGEEYV